MQKRMRYIVICGLSGFTTFFSHYLINGRNFGKKKSGLRAAAAARKPETQPSTPHCTDNLKTKHQIRQTATTCIIL
jgi:hypothetical protein